MIIKIINAVHARFVLYRRARVLGDTIRGLLPPNARVLDVGCGDGTIASSWMEGRSDLKVQGIDVLIRPATKIPVTAFDGQHIPFQDNSFDVVAFIDVLHHTENPLQLLREAKRISTQIVVIKDHYAENWFDRVTLAFMDWVGNAPHGVSLTYNYLSRKQWSQVFEVAALSQSTVKTNFLLYSFPFNMIFGRRLHFVVLLRKR